MTAGARRRRTVTLATPPRPATGAVARTAGADAVLVAVSGSPHSEALVLAARQLAQTVGAGWEAIHVETPRPVVGQGLEAGAADALRLAARLGATIVTVPAGDVAAGILAHLDTSPAGHVVLGSGATGLRARFGGRSVSDALMASGRELVLHVHMRATEPGRRQSDLVPLRGLSAPATSYLAAAGAVALTLLVGELLLTFLGSRPLDLLFLFPVIAAATRLGLGPALFAAALSVVGYNFVLLQPAFSFNPTAPQNLVMSGVLAAVAVYTSALTTRMRGRLLLSDRSAHESASVAALAQKLTRDADWGATARTTCEHVHGLLSVATALYREVKGELTLAAACPSEPVLSPVDRAALDWAWNEGEEAGAGTLVLPAADWQFQPLKTSLGVLAVLGLAREDGRDPVRPDRRTLLLTLVSQAALAHERLRLEDFIRGGLESGTSEA